MRSRASSGGSFVDNLYFGSNGTIVARSLIVESDGVFKGSLSGATGTFSGNLSAVGGTFTGNLSAVGGTFRGDLQAVGGTFTGTLQGVDGSFSGTVSASSIVGGTITGNTSITGATINITTEATVGKWLTLSNPSLGGVRFCGISSGIEVFGDAIAKTLILQSGGGGVWAGNNRLDIPLVAKFA